MDDQKDSSLFGGVTSWLRKPFDTQGSAVNWILFVGVLVIAAFFWNVVLLEITSEI